MWGGSLLLGVGALLAVAGSTFLWERRRLASEVTMALFLVSTVFGLISELPLLTIVAITCIGLWLLLVAARLRFGRLEPTFLQPSTRLNVVAGAGLIVLVLVATFFLQAVPLEFLFVILALISIVVAIVFLSRILWAARHLALPAPRLSLRELPAVSVCIPARNEDTDLAECIAAVLRSDYPKLEVIVLDDCSQDKTAEVIRSFAHSGVRFVQGDVPASGWLGKNQAMQTMAQHASGELLVFMSVDTLVGKNTVTQLVHYALAKKMQMISVLPQNHLAVGFNTLFGTLQYFWQIALPITSRRVPVSGKLWLINAKTLNELGGFESVKHKIVPEGSFARRLFSKDAYRFFVGDHQLDASTTKSLAAQITTSMRLLYPTFKRQPMYVLAGVLGLVAAIFLPFLMVVIGLATGVWSIFALNTIAVVLCMLDYAFVLRRTHPGSWLLGFLALPIVVVQEIGLLITSMLAYEFSEVNWKGRNVCYPVISRGQTSRRPQAESLR